MRQHSQRPPRPTLRTLLAAAAFAGLAALPLGAQAPHIYAITNARIVTAAGAPIEVGTVVFRDGVIDQVGADVAAPAGARVFDGKGLTVYPGLIDMGNTAAFQAPPAPPATPPPTTTTPRTTEDAERAKRENLLKSHVRAAEHVAADTPAMRKLAAAGITSALAVPNGVVFAGQSALVNVVLPDDEPQIGALADLRRGQPVVRTPVALHVGVPDNPPGEGYPNSLMGVVAFIRQTFIDAQHHGALVERATGSGRETPGPAFDPALEAMQPVLTGKMPVVYRANTAREIERALDMAGAFKLDLVVAGAREADLLAGDLKARNARVIVSLRYPERAKSLAPDADEPLRDLRARADAPKTPAALEKAGILFAFESGGMEEPKDFVRNAAKAVKAGLSPEAAIKALTINAATIAGAGTRVGSIERGKIANVIVTDGDLFAEKTAIKHVFVDGRPIRIDEPARSTR